jgi:hypothetical protein
MKDRKKYMKDYHKRPEAKQKKIEYIQALHELRRKHPKEFQKILNKIRGEK